MNQLRFSTEVLRPEAENRGYQLRCWRCGALKNSTVVVQKINSCYVRSGVFSCYVCVCSFISHAGRWRKQQERCIL
jgi:hypothetical protein